MVRRRSVVSLAGQLNKLLWILLCIWISTLIIVALRRIFMFGEPMPLNGKMPSKFEDMGSAHEVDLMHLATLP